MKTLELLKKKNKNANNKHLLCHRGPGIGWGLAGCS